VCGRQGCQIFLGATYQNRETIPNDHTYNTSNDYKIPIPNGRKSVWYTKWPQKYDNIVHNKTIENLPKLGIFGLKIYHMATLVEGVTGTVRFFLSLPRARFENGRRRETRFFSFLFRRDDDLHF
jgi:hypothetical protein